MKRKNIILAVAIFCVIAATIFVGFHKKATFDMSFEKDAILTETITLPSDIVAMKFNDNFIVRAKPALIYDLSNKTAELYLTSPITNSCNIRCEVYADYNVVYNNPFATLSNIFGKHDNDFVLIGSSALIKPGQTLQSIKLDRVPDRQCSIIIKYVAYKNDLTSSGSFDVPITLFIVNSNGEMIDKNGKVQKVK